MKKLLIAAALVMAGSVAVADTTSDRREAAEHFAICSGVFDAAKPPGIEARQPAQVVA